MTMTPLLRLTIAITLIGLVLLRPYNIQDRGLWYVDDDYDYFAHTSAMVFGQFPSYHKEFFTILKEGPQSPIGSSILAAPFVAVFSLLDLGRDPTIFQARTLANITGSWSQFGFVAASVFYFTLACVLLYAGVSRAAAPAFASTAVVLMMVCQGLPLFVFRRPFFSHCSEFFLQSVLTYLLLTQKDFSRKFMAGVMACAALLYLTRPNDFAFALLWPLLMMDFKHGINTALHRSSAGLIVSVGLVLLFKVWPEGVNHLHPYSWAGQFLSAPMDQAAFFHRVRHILAGEDWGLVFTAPFLLLGLAGILLIRNDLLKKYLWLLLPMAINFYVIISWGSQGGWYGYRYFIASAIPPLTLPLALALQWASRKLRWGAMLLVLLISLPPLLSMTAFEGDPIFNLQQQPVDFNRTDFTNLYLQTNVWGALRHIPLVLGLIILEGPIGIVCALLGKTPPLTAVTWIRILVLLAVPWLVYAFYRRRDIFLKSHATMVG